MTRRASTGRIAVALVLGAGLTASAMNAGAAPKLAAVTQNAAIAPRFDPEAPAKLDEFTANPNVKSVHFDFNRAALRTADAKIIDRDASWLKANQPYEVVVEGYADERGTKPYNVRLAKRRALSVRDRLVAQGVQPDRIVMVSYGEARPECRMKARSESCWSKNQIGRAHV